MNDIKTAPKHVSIVTFSLTALVVVMLSTLISNIFGYSWYGLVSAAVMVAVAILLHIFAKTKPILYLFSFAINSVAVGRALSAYYLTFGEKPPVSDLIIFSLPAAAILIFVGIMLTLDKKTKRITLILATLVNLCMLAWFLVMWISSVDAGFSYGFFTLVLSLGYLLAFGVSVGHDERPVLRDISFASFSIVVSAVLAAISLLSRKKIKEKQ